MPLPHEHLERARQNKQFAYGLAGLERGFVVDWAITMLFYSAVHYIDAYLAQKHAKPMSHEEREEEIENNGSLADIHKPYRRLKDMSRAARYELANYGVKELEIAKQKLADIERHMDSLYR